MGTYDRLERICWPSQWLHIELFSLVGQSHSASSTQEKGGPCKKEVAAVRRARALGSVERRTRLEDIVADREEEDGGIRAGVPRCRIHETSVEPVNSDTRVYIT